MLRQSRVLFTATIVFVLGVMLVACPGPRRPAPPAQPEQPTLKPVPGAQAFDIMPAASLVRIVVYRGGTLSTMGHNHVIASHEVYGKVYLHPDLKRSAFEVIMPLQTLTVDEPELRRKEGEGFPPEVPDSAKEGTRRNLLSAALLDAEKYPTIRLISTGIGGAEPKIEARVRVGIKGQWHELTVPLELKKQRDQLTASGQFKVTHAALGLEPFSAVLGALKVQDEMTVKFGIVANASR